MVGAIMRIILAHTQLTSYGGGERATLELARRLSARHTDNLHTSHYTPERTFPALADVPLRIVSPAAWLTQPLDADAIVAQNFGARLLALRHHAVIAYLHTMRSRYLLGGARVDLAARRALDRRVVRRAAYLLANSAFTAARATAVYGRTPEVALLGADEALFALPPRAGAYALYVGRLAPEKGVARLLEWNATAPLPLEVVGAGSAAGLAALDAMAAAKPVIAVREGALPELVEDGVTGFLVRDASEYQRAAHLFRADDALCLRWGLPARERPRAYS